MSCGVSNASHKLSFLTNCLCYAFASTTSIQVFESEQKAAISNNYLKVFSLMAGNMFPDVSHYIIKLQSTDRDGFQTYDIEFTTDYVRR